MRIGDILIGGLIIILLIVLSPILVPLIVYTIIRDWIGKLRFKSFLRANNGAKYFCYTARKTSYQYVTDHVLPNLPSDTQIIYLADRKNAVDVLGDQIPFVDHLVWRMKKTPGRYPYVSKVSNGELVTMSINHQLYSAIKRKADAEAINKKISRFLSGDD